MDIWPPDWHRYPAPLCTVRDRRLARDWDDLVKKVKLMMAAYETLPSRDLHHDIELELVVLDNVCRKWVGDGLLYRPELQTTKKVEF